jgi:hypothetical protein
MQNGGKRGGGGGGGVWCVVCGVEWSLRVSE